MIACTDQGANSIEPGNKATWDFCFQEALAVSGVIDTLKEGEGGWVRGTRRIQGISQVLEGDVAVPDDLAISVQILRGVVVGECWVREEAGVEALCLDSDGEGGAGSNRLAKLGFEDNSRNHVRG